MKFEEIKLEALSDKQLMAVALAVLLKHIAKNRFDPAVALADEIEKRLREALQG